MTFRLNIVKTIPWSRYWTNWKVVFKPNKHPFPRYSNLSTSAKKANSWLTYMRLNNAKFIRWLETAKYIDIQQRGEVIKQSPKHTLNHISHSLFWISFNYSIEKVVFRIWLTNNVHIQDILFRKAILTIFSNMWISTITNKSINMTPGYLT